MKRRKKNGSSGKPEPCQLLLQVSTHNKCPASSKQSLGGNPISSFSLSRLHRSLQIPARLISDLPQAPLNSRLVLEFTKLNLSTCSSSSKSSSPGSSSHSNTSNSSSSSESDNSCSFLVIDLDPPNTFGRETFSRRFVQTSSLSDTFFLPP